MSENKKDKNFKDGIVGLILFFLVLAFWYFSWQYIDSKVISDTEKLSNHEVRGLFGDKFGAVNALFSALAFAGIIFTILLQKRELKLQREELEETRGEFIKQNETLQKQRFENTFFQLLSLHNEIVDKLKIKPIDGETYEKREFFVGAVKDLKYRSTCEYFKYSALTKLEPKEVNDFKGNREIQHDFFHRLEKDEIKNLQSLANQDIENFISEPIENKEDILKTEYERFFHRYQYNLGHYFRNLYHIFKYVHKTDLIGKKEKQFYCNIVRAQLSTDELVLIFYNSMTAINYYSDKPNLGYPNFKYLIDQYDILQNMNSRLLLDRRHKEIFDKNKVELEPETFKIKH